MRHFYVCSIMMFFLNVYRVIVYYLFSFLIFTVYDYETMESYLFLVGEEEGDEGEVDFFEERVFLPLLFEL